MPSEERHACTLTTDELSVRVAEIRAVGALALSSARAERGQAELRFRAAPGVRARLEAIVAVEARCCAFLDLRLEDRADAHVLTIRAPAGGEPVMGELVEAFGGAAPAL